MEEILRKTKFQLHAKNAIIGMPSGFPSFPVDESGKKVVSAHLNGKFDWMMVFVVNVAALTEIAPKALNALNPNGILWFCFPKKSSKIKTDLSRDHGWEILDKLQTKYLNLVGIDATWSGFGITHGSAQTKAKTEKVTDKRNSILTEFMDHGTKEMRYPSELEAILESNLTEKEFFHQLSFTNRKEYVEWIITAKRQETKNQRLAKTLEYLQQRQKNPTGQ